MFRRTLFHRQRKQSFKISFIRPHSFLHRFFFSFQPIMASRLASLALRGSKSSRRNFKSLIPIASRNYASTSEALVASDNLYLRYNSPVPSTADHTDILSNPGTKVTTLSNGLRVATETIPFTESATVGAWIDAGSRFETDETNGTAHFLEHMIFKGTKSRTVHKLEREIENMGGHLNAYTSREQTTYFAKVVKQHVPAAIDILSDILQNSDMDEKMIERERSTILREMQEVGKNPQEVLFDHLHATAFQYSPLGRTILGPEENIKKIGKSDIANYVSTHYTAPRMVISAAGSVDHDELVKLVEKKFNSLPTDPTSAADLVAQQPSIFTGSEVRIRDDDMPLCHFVAALKGPGWTDPDTIPLIVMQVMLGSYNSSNSGSIHMGSELAQKIASNKLAESVSAFNTNYTDAGLFGIYGVGAPEHLDDLAYCMMHELTRMVYRVTEEDVVRAKNIIKSSAASHLDGSTPIAEDIGRQLLTYGRRIPLHEFFARIDAVDASTVKRVAERFIFDKDLAIAVNGPSQFLPDYNWFRRRTYWLRY